jgi:SAM-dependent methyltransferase
VPRAMTRVPLLRSQAFRELTRYAPTSTKSVLDVGCGAGDFLVEARKLGLKVRGAEISDSAAAPARERGLECAGSFACLAETGEHYDVVRLSDVLEHLADPIHALKAVASCLAPAGVAIIRVPNVDGPIARICGPDWYQLDAPRHLWSFGPESLSLLLGRAGLKAGRLETVSQEWLLFSSLRNLLKSQAGLELPVDAKPEVRRLCAQIGWALDSEGWGDTLLVIAEHRPQ